MFRLHDAENWADLIRNAQEMLIALGYDRKNATHAAKFILAAYRASDRAVRAQTVGDIVEEDKAYVMMRDNFVKASECLHLETASLRFKMGWYWSARHRKPLRVLYYLFREHLERFNLLRMDVIMLTTWTAFFGAYFAHKEHNWTKLESAMVKYWRCVRWAYPIRPPIQI